MTGTGAQIAPNALEATYLKGWSCALLTGTKRAHGHNLISLPKSQDSRNIIDRRLDMQNHFRQVLDIIVAIRDDSCADRRHPNVS